MEKEIVTWSEFKKRVDSMPTDGVPPLFRGQGHKDWPLVSTLFRTPEEFPEMTADWYLRLHREVYDKYSLFISKDVDPLSITSPAFNINGKLLDQGYPHHFELTKEAAKYLIYLRHMGVSSPLLDVTHSPYIAAFFAFLSPPPDATHVAIFCQQNPWAYSIDQRGDLFQLIRNQSSNIHDNHRLQQGAYLINFFVENKSTCKLSKQPFDAFFGQKFEIEVSERRKVLNDLNRMNINEYTLLGTFRQTFTHEVFIGAKFSTNQK